MSLKSFILQSLFVLLFCTSFLSAAEPVDLFGIHEVSHLSVKAYVGSRSYPTPITRHFLVSEAQEFWRVLQRNILPKLNEPDKPGMVSALYTGDGKIYFATSIKGFMDKRRSLGFPPFINKALRGCREDGRPSHNFDERCAELMVLKYWHSLNRGRDWDPHLKGKLIVAVDHNLRVEQPCPQGFMGICHFGCADVLKKLGFITALEIVETDPTIAGKPAPKKPTATSPQVKPKPPSNVRVIPGAPPPSPPAKRKPRRPRKPTESKR